MQKTELLKQQMGNTLHENFGARVGDPPTAVTTNLDAQRVGRKRATNAALIDVERIVADGQIREDFDEEEIAKLAHSIKEKGQLQPVRVRWDERRDRYVIIMGERRWRAAKAAGIHQLECVVHEGEPTDDEILEMQLIENIIRQDLNPIEEAKAYKKLMEKKNWTGKRLAQEFRLNPSTVTRSIRLLTLPEDIQEQVASGVIPPGVAREVVKLETEAEQRELIQRFLTDGLTSADTAAAVGKKKNGGKRQLTNKTKKTFTIPGGIKIVVTSKKKETNVAIAEALRQAIEVIETDGRSKRDAA